MRKPLSIALGLIVLGCIWFYLAPPPLGGSTTYVVTHGISMEPRFHTGDLALVRSQSSYHVGEIVAYHNKMLHTIVLHRIIGREGNRYIFKGDNNNFVDFEHPAASQLIGALRLHIPGVGATLQSIRSPALVGILVAVGMLLLTGGAFAQRRRRRRRQRRAGENAQHPPRRLPQHTPEPVLSVLAIGLVALLPFVALALLAFTRPTTTRRPFNIPYKQSGALSYSAAAPEPTYPGGRVVTGDPLFTRVLSAVDLRFDYLFHTPAKHSLAGRASLAATITSTSGWQTTLPLGEPTYFRGDRALVTATLDLSSILALIHSVQTTTRVSASDTLTIAPRVSVNGSLDLAPLHTTFSPEIKFTLSELEAQPLVSGSSSLAAGQLPTSQFAPSTPGSLPSSRYQPLYLALGIARPSVATARAIALIGIAILTCAMLAMLALIRPMLAFVRQPGRDESAAIRARYGRMIVPVARVWQLPGVPVIDVADMDALAQIAEHYDRSILHETTAEGDAFWITDESGQFRYALGASARTESFEAVQESPLDVLASDVYTDHYEWAPHDPAADTLVLDGGAWQAAYEAVDVSHPGIVGGLIR